MGCAITLLPEFCVHDGEDVPHVCAGCQLADVSHEEDASEEDASVVDADSGGGIYRVASASFCARHPSAWSWLVQSGELLDDASRCPSA